MIRSLLIHPEELSIKWIDRMAELGVTALTLHPTGGLSADKSLENMLDMLKTEEYRSYLDYAVKRGLTVEYEFHAAGYLLPRTLFETHPEYFRMNSNGVRTPDINLCVSDPDALDIVSKRAAEVAKRLYLTSDRYYFWMDDVDKNSCCSCEKCRALSASDQQMAVMNAIIKELRKTNANATLSFLAYRETLTPPTKIKPEPGIFLEYAPIERKPDTPIEEQAGTGNIRALLDLFGTKNAAVLEYWYDNSLLSHWKKPPLKFVPYNGVIKKDIEFYRSLGFENIRSFACFLGKDYEDLYGEPDLSAFNYNDQ